MQSLNNLTPRGQKLLIGAVTIFIILPIFYLAYTTASDSDPSKKGSYYDKASGETVTNNNQTPETFGTDGNNQTYLGIADLLTIGVSQYQVTALKTALTDYGKTRTPQSQEYSVATKTISLDARDPEGKETADTVRFDVLVNRKDTYKATLRYFDITSIKLTLNAKNGELIYSSPTIDGSKTTNE